MTTSEVLNLFALIFIPLVAVVIGRWLQDRSERRKDKMNIFKAVMTFRYGWSYEGVNALNNIHVVFSNDEDVRQCWREYYKLLCIQDPNSMELMQRENALYKLLESMAYTLGYKGKIAWDDIQTPYIPKGMLDSMTNQVIVQQGVATLIQQMNTSSTIKQSSDI